MGAASRINCGRPTRNSRIRSSRTSATWGLPDGDSSRIRGGRAFEDGQVIIAGLLPQPAAPGQTLTSVTASERKDRDTPKASSARNLDGGFADGGVGTFAGSGAVFGGGRSLPLQCKGRPSCGHERPASTTLHALKRP
jgi:hypothetical protein